MARGLKTKQHTNRINMKQTIILFTLALLTMAGIDVSAQTPGRKIVKHPYYKQGKTQKRDELKSEQEPLSPTPQTYTPVLETEVYKERTDSNWVTLYEIEQNVNDLNRLCPLQLTEGVILMSIYCSWADDKPFGKYRPDKSVRYQIAAGKDSGYFRKNLKKGYMHYIKNELLHILKNKFPSLIENLKKHKKQCQLESSYKPEEDDISIECILWLGKPEKKRYCNSIEIEPSEM